MNMRSIAKKFTQNEDGNATVDWVVLTAGMVTLAVSIGIMVQASAGAATDKVNAALEEMEPPVAGG